MAKRSLDFGRVNAEAMAVILPLLHRWLHGGSLRGQEYIALNPTRSDGNPGSFKVNVSTGRWADFATGDRGGDPISLYAYLHKLSQLEAARRLAAILGVNHD
jgi:hypothetical protein